MSLQYLFKELAMARKRNDVSHVVLNPQQAF